jgi:hypothetical protein
MSKTVSEILNAAADLLEKPGAWTQGAFSRNADGSADYGEEDEEPIVAATPVCWCALGAIAQVTDRDPLALPTFSEAYPTETGQAKRFLAGMLGVSVEIWNDASGRTQAEVVAKLREAAALSKASETEGGEA